MLLSKDLLNKGVLLISPIIHPEQAGGERSTGGKGTHAILSTIEIKKNIKKREYNPELSKKKKRWLLAGF